MKKAADRHHDYHTFKRRERIEVSAGGRALSKATGLELDTSKPKARCCAW